jgi:membrane protein
MIAIFRKFLEQDIWVMPAGANCFCNFGLRFLRSILLALRLYFQNQCPLKASALTYYTIFSLVPVAALFFGIAQLCGIADVLEKKVRSWFHLYPEAANLVISFSYDTLREAKGGVIAGAGVLLLIWATVKLLSNIEYSLNSIWGVRRGRSLIRKVTDYIAIIVVCPILFMTTISGLVFASSAMVGMLNNSAIIAFIPAGMLAKGVPLAAIWGGLTFLYMVMPNTRVRFAAAFSAGLFAAIIYLSFQYLYIYSQFMLVKQNTIYGSFAALPLLLLYLHISWLVFLAGAQLAFAFQNESAFE